MISYTAKSTEKLPLSGLVSGNTACMDSVEVVDLKIRQRDALFRFSLTDNFDSNLNFPNI
jgi:hypothetical protein